MNFTQQPRALMMVRPSAFGFNALTAGTNEFQKKPAVDEGIQLQALGEFDRMSDLLRAHEIELHVFQDDKTHVKPDAIFPNNWISFHQDGSVVLYPMMAHNRRTERRMDVVETLKSQFQIHNIIDLSVCEEQSEFLEGTGSVVFDHRNRIAYAARSPRTSEKLVAELCHRLGYKPLVFDAFDHWKQPIYHTNVLLSVGAKFAMVCLDAIISDTDQEALLESFSATGHQVIAISYEQMQAFAGNVLEVMTANNDPVVLLSRTAYNSLIPGQVDALTRFAELLPMEISTIETCGGGSVRCMVAGIHLPERNTL